MSRIKSLRPTHIYLKGVVAKLEKEFPNNTSRYRVINGDWTLMVDHISDEAYNFQTGPTKDDVDPSRYPIEYKGPFPDSISTYTTHIPGDTFVYVENIATGKIVLEQEYKTSDPVYTSSTSIKTEEFYQLYCLTKDNKKIYYCTSHSWDPPGWHSYGNPYKFNTLTSALNELNRTDLSYLPSWMNSCRDFSIEKIIKRFTTVCETETADIQNTRVVPGQEIISQ